MENDLRFESYQEARIEWKRYLRILHRRRWWFAIPAFAVWAIIWVMSWLLPTIYRSETVILVEQQNVPEQYVIANIGDDLQQRLQSMTQQILSRTRLLRIIDEFNLYKDRSGDDRVDRMREDIQIEIVQAPGRNDLSAFKIAYLSKNPQIAQDVVSKLSSLFIEENLKARQQRSVDTTEFLESQLEEARKNLAAQEERVRDFKSRYLGELPGQVQTNVQILAGLQARREQDVEALGQARQQNVYLESMLNQLRSAEANMRVGRTATSQALPSLDTEIEKLQTQLAELTSRYSDEHPDVRKLKNQLTKAERLKAKRESDVATALRVGDFDGNTTRPSSFAELQAMSPRLQVESQLKANRLEMENRQRNMLENERQISQYQSRLNTSPLREQQLADLTRDYDQSRKNYEQLLAKRDQSELATNMEIRQQGERFRIIDPANLPQKPYLPNRFKLALIGLCAGVLVGYVSIIGSEILDDCVYSSEDLSKVVAAPVLVELPALLTASEHIQRAKHNQLQLIAMTAMILTPIAGVGISRFFG
jgi:polysaccharide biosynthesis transport protein